VVNQADTGHMHGFGAWGKIFLIRDETADDRKIWHRQTV
jgi:hypothetical protein